MKKRVVSSIPHLFSVAGILLLFLFSAFLMFQTFSYDRNKSEIIMSSHLWSDFGAHIPLIRSFSYGSNWPPEYPLFPGEKIRYHFLFYAISGLLERAGLQIDWAVNIPSILGFFGLTIGIYALGVVLFKRKLIGALGVLFFLFNGTLSFLNFFKLHPLSFQTPMEIITATKFPSFAPWDKSWVTAFWNLNVYTNQRHLAFSFAIVIAALLILLKYTLTLALSQMEREKIHSFPLWGKVRMRVFPGSFNRSMLSVSVFIALAASTLLFLNQAALLVLIIYFLYFFLFQKESRVPLMLGALTSLPFLLLFRSIALPTGIPTVQPGFLTPNPKTFLTFILFWIHNLGIHIVLIPLGILISPKTIRRFSLPLFILFALSNLVRFSTDMINNHKILNFFYIMGNLYSAAFLVWIWDRRKKYTVPAIFVLGVLLLFSTLSGIIDFFVVVNDYHLVLSDVPVNAAAQFAKTHIPKKAIVLNSTWFYDPASIAGRPIYNGYAFFTWSAGYDTYKREEIVKKIFHAQDLSEACPVLQRERIAYVEINKNPDEYLKPISTLWTNKLQPIYKTPDGQITFYEVSRVCDL